MADSSGSAIHYNNFISDRIQKISIEIWIIKKSSLFLEDTSEKLPLIYYSVSVNIK